MAQLRSTQKISPDHLTRPTIHLSRSQHARHNGIAKTHHSPLRQQFRKHPNNHHPNRRSQNLHPNPYRLTRHRNRQRQRPTIRRTQLTTKNTRTKDMIVKPIQGACPTCWRRKARAIPWKPGTTCWNCGLPKSKPKPKPP